LHSLRIAQKQRGKGEILLFITLGPLEILEDSYLLQEEPNKQPANLKEGVPIPLMGGIIVEAEEILIKE